MTDTLADLDQEISHNMRDSRKVASLVNDYQGHLVGTHDTESRKVSYSLVFADVFHAAAFAQTARKWFASVDFRFDSEVMSLDDAVTLVAVTR